MTKARVLVDLSQNRKYVLENYKVMSIGRAEDNDIVTSKDIIMVSRHHAEIINKNGQVFVWDKNSRFGTYIYKENEKEKKEVVYRKTYFPLDCILELSKGYRFKLEERDLVAEHSREKNSKIRRNSCWRFRRTE